MNVIHGIGYGSSDTAWTIHLMLTSVVTLRFPTKFTNTATKIQLVGSELLDMGPNLASAK